MRTAFYARYSTDLQSAASIEDQLYKLKERATFEGWHTATTYSDAATSGASMMRPGIQALMQDAAQAKFDIVLCEALDRLSRNQADIARIYEQLSFHGVKIITLSEGLVSELHIGLKGTMNALFLKDLGDKTRRGLEGRVRAGKSGGGKAYGYSIPVKYAAGGERLSGDTVINAEEANTIVRIFEQYGAGKSPRAIAHSLNEDGICGPNGKSWGASTINGNRRRGTGIINNELYIGRRIWNRLKYIKDPSTGKRISRLNPEVDRVTAEVPNLRIVSSELWEQVKERQKTLDASKNGATRPFHSKQRPKYFWSGKLKCGQCGGSYTKVSKDLLGCATSRNKGTSICDNRKNIRVDILEDHLLASLQHHLMEPEHFAVFIEAFAQELNRLQGEARGERTSIENRITRLNVQLDKAVDAILAGANARRLNERMITLEAEKAELEQRLSFMDGEPQILLHPNMSRIYKEKVAKLSEAFKADHADANAFDAIRSLLDTVILHPTASGFDFDIQGELANILALSSNGKQSAAALGFPSFKTTKPSEIALEGSSELAEQVKMVAGVGFEPTAFRL